MERPDIAGWNLALRFALEIAALAALAVAGHRLGAGASRWILAIVLPAAAALLWVVFNVPGDPSRSGEAPVEVDGWVRLGVEMIVLGGGAVAIWFLGRPVLAVGFVALVVVQYVAALDRIRWMVER